MIRAAAALCAFAFAAAAQDYESLQSERVATGLQYADGVVWSKDGFLIFADVLKKVLYRLDPGQKPSPTNEDKNGAQGLAFDAAGRLYICESDTRRIVRVDKKNTPEVLVDKFEGKKLNAPNDIAVRKDGQVYFTDPAFASQVDRRELDFYGIFHLTPKGEMEAVARWKTRPNGVAISADGKSLFVVDSDRHAVVAFDLDVKTGGASNPRDVVTKIEGVPGGLKTDVAGRFYVAADGLAIYSPAGKLLHTLVKGEKATNCAFGDTDFETLYVCGRKAVYRVRLGVKGAVQY